MYRVEFKVVGGEEKPKQSAYWWAHELTLPVLPTVGQRITIYPDAEHIFERISRGLEPVRKEIKAQTGRYPSTHFRFKTVQVTGTVESISPWTIYGKAPIDGDEISPQLLEIRVTITVRADDEVWEKLKKDTTWPEPVECYQWYSGILEAKLRNEQLMREHPDGEWHACLHCDEVWYGPADADDEDDCPRCKEKGQ